MEYGSNLSVSCGSAAAVAPHRKRRYYRQQVSSLLYVNVNQGNGGIIRDLSETGIAVQAVTPLQLNEQVQLRFELLNPRVRVETNGRVAWADSTGQAGVEFGVLSRRSHRSLKEWLFTHLLSSAHHAAWDTIFADPARGAEPQLQFSPGARPPIRLAARVTAVRASNDARRATLHILGTRTGIQARLLSRLLDGLILTVAVLLFSAVGISMTHIFPSWPAALIMLTLVGAFIACLYGFLFNFWVGATPGACLAKLACSDEMGPEEEDRPRFR
jgi:Tfp pilus assembly protein PilZ